MYNIYKLPYFKVVKQFRKCVLRDTRSFSTKKDENFKKSTDPMQIVKKATAITVSAAVFVGAAVFLLSRNRRNVLNVDNLNNSINISKISQSKTDEEPNLRQQFNFFEKVVKKCAPSVVYIEIKDSRRLDPETGLPVTTSNGSGFIIRDDGWIITNAHVVINKPHATIKVIMNDGTSYNATVEDADMNIDLALLKIHTENHLPYLKLGNSVDTSVGEWVIALGSPLSLSHSVTVGVISSTNREASELGLKNYSMKYIQTDASITFGNSGGPLVNLDGDVIGINNLRITSGISFAIPIDYVKGFLERNKFLSDGQNVNNSMDDKLLGITTFKMTPNLISELSEKKIDVPYRINHGVLVWKVINGTLAQMSGLEAGDIITHINGVPVRETSDIYLLLTNKTENSVQKVKIIRKGKEKEIPFKSP